MSWLRWLNPVRWLKRDITLDQLIKLGFNVGPTVGGVTLTTDAALGVSAVWCASRVIAEDLATLPMLVYSGHRLDDGAKPLFEDPISQLLASPNPEITAPVLWASWQHAANIWGFGLLEIIRNGAGRPVELVPIPPPCARIDRQAGRLVFYGEDADRRPVRLDPADVLFLPGLTPDGSCGYKLLQIARQTLGLHVAAQRFGTARFRNGLNPTGAIRYPGALSDPARENMRASWRALYGGPDQAAAPMILEEGTSWERFELAHNDQLQLMELLDAGVDDVARFFNISPVKLHKLGRATWGNLETLNRDHVISTLGPWIAKRDAEIDRKLLTPGRHCRHIVDRLLTADTATRYAAWNSAVSAGWLTPNEARAREDLQPLPGGNVLLRPLNQGPADAQAADPDDPTPELVDPPNDPDDPTPGAGGGTP